MNLTTAINVFLRQSLRVGGFPFEVRLDQPNKEIIAAMLEAERIAHDVDVKPENASKQMVDQHSENVAIVDVNGQVKGVSIGKTMITATAINGSKVTAQYKIIVVSSDFDEVGLEQ